METEIYEALALNKVPRNVDNKVLQFEYWRLETGSPCSKNGAKVSKEQEISVLIMENGDRDI